MNAYAYVLGNPMTFKDPSGHGILQWLPVALMMSQDINKRASSLKKTVFSASDPLAEWTMYSVSGVSTLKRATGGTSEIISQSPIAAGGRTSNAAHQVGNVVSPNAPPIKKVGFNQVTEVFEYKQRMGPEHWTTEADEITAAAEYTQELGIEPNTVAPSSSSSARSSHGQAQKVVRQGTKKPSVISQAGRRRYQ